MRLVFFATIHTIYTIPYQVMRIQIRSCQVITIHPPITINRACQSLHWTTRKAFTLTLEGNLCQPGRSMDQDQDSGITIFLFQSTNQPDRNGWYHRIPLLQVCNLIHGAVYCVETANTACALEAVGTSEVGRLGRCNCSSEGSTKPPFSITTALLSDGIEWIHSSSCMNRTSMRIQIHIDQRRNK